MLEPLHRKIFLGLIEVHILHHAAKEPFYGSWMMEELARHGYQVGPSLIYPLLRELCQNGWLELEICVETGRQKKYYRITEAGREALAIAKRRLFALTEELLEGST